jgi:hypothetical protein
MRLDKRIKEILGAGVIPALVVSLFTPTNTIVIATAFAVFAIAEIIRQFVGGLEVD